MSTAVKMFVIQSVNTGSIPFKIKREISDTYFQMMIGEKLPVMKVSASDNESMNEFFGDENFLEYEGDFDD